MRKTSVLIFFFLSLFSQAQKVGGVNLCVKENSIQVNYYLSAYPLNRVYFMKLNIIDDKGNFYSPRSVKGDLQKVYPGYNKKITWDVLKDTFSLKGDFQAEVEIVRAYNVKFQDGPRCALASVCLPGLGDYSVYENAGPLPVLVGAAWLGSLSRAGYKYYAFKTYQHKFSKLQTACTNPNSWATREDAENMKQLSQLNLTQCRQSLIAAFSIWAIDIAHVAIKGAINQRRKLNEEISGKLKSDDL